jgi:hypothetical protein
MTKTKLYKYIGYNGTLITPILLEGIPHKVYYKLQPENGKVLVNGSQKALVITVMEDEVDQWTEE